MTKEELLQRIADLDLALSQTQASYNALIGRKQECEFQLEQLKKKESEGASA